MPQFCKARRGSATRRSKADVRRRRLVALAACGGTGRLGSDAAGVEAAAKRRRSALAFDLGRSRNPLGRNGASRERRTRRPASTQSGRIPKHDLRSPGDSDRSKRAVAARRFGERLRQRRGGAPHVFVLDGSLSRSGRRRAELGDRESSATAAARQESLQPERIASGSHDDRKGLSFSRRHGRLLLLVGLAQRRRLEVLSAGGRLVSLPHLRVGLSKSRQAGDVPRDGRQHAPDRQKRPSRLLRRAARRAEGFRVRSLHGTEDDDLDTPLRPRRCEHRQASRRRRVRRARLGGAVRRGRRAAQRNLASPKPPSSV